MRLFLDMGTADVSPILFPPSRRQVGEQFALHVLPQRANQLAEDSFLVPTQNEDHNQTINFLQGGHG